MGELRKDYILNKYAVIATERAKKPEQFNSEPESKEVNICFFCPGNEGLTPEEKGSAVDANGWFIRWFDNKFPALKAEGKSEVTTDNEFFTFADNYGHHEVIVESPNHLDDLADLSVKHLEQLLRVYNNRINDLEKDPNIKYVLVMKNHLQKAGTSIKHTHSQVFAMPIIPTTVLDKVAASKERGKDVYQRITAIEKLSDRRCFENNTVVAFCPYASRYPFEMLILPKTYKRRLSDFTNEEYCDLAEILKKVLLKLKALNAPFNMYLHYAPKGEEMCFQIEITPRLTTWAGFEKGTDIIINPMPPEKAAEYYRTNVEVLDDVDCKEI